jgi:hypothetical protein
MKYICWLTLISKIHNPDAQGILLGLNMLISKVGLIFSDTSGLGVGIYKFCISHPTICSKLAAFLLGDGRTLFHGDVLAWLLGLPVSSLGPGKGKDLLPRTEGYRFLAHLHLHLLAHGVEVFSRQEVAN